MTIPSPMSLDMSQDTMTMLTKAQYAAHHGITEKTVQRDLNAACIPGAIKDERGRWLIPATAQRLDRSNVVAIQPEPAQISYDDLVAQWPAYVPLDAAAYALGIPVTAIRRERQHFQLEPFGPHGALVMPRHRIKEILG